MASTDRGPISSRFVRLHSAMVTARLLLPAYRTSAGQGLLSGDCRDLLNLEVGDNRPALARGAYARFDHRHDRQNLRRRCGIERLAPDCRVYFFIKDALITPVRRFTEFHAKFVPSTRWIIV